MIDRRTLLTASAATLASACATDATGESTRRFPRGFLWGASTAGHQVEGANVSSDLWCLEHVPGSAFAVPSGDAVNSFNLWPTDLDLVRSMRLNAYRFSIEWSRIEPVEGEFSRVMLDHYKAMIAGCRARGLKTIVTFNHFTAPLWFSADGGWTNPAAPARFARYCTYLAEAIAGDIDIAITMNEPQILKLLRRLLPDFVTARWSGTLSAAEAQLHAPHFSAVNFSRFEDIDRMQGYLLEGHAAARAAIKRVRADLPVGVSLSMLDDQEGEPGSMRDAMRADLYGQWLDAARADDFVGVQNYERKIWGRTGPMPPPADAVVNFRGGEVYAPSLAGAVRYAHAATGVPVLVSEHGVGTDDDRVRQNLIPEALRHLKDVMDEGVPVLGYCHWSLLDNYEWDAGFAPKFGLASVDRTTFARTLKPSASVYAAIARANAV